MSLTIRILEALKKVTDSNNPAFDREIFERVRTDAYYISQHDKERKNPEFYWDIALKFTAYQFRRTIKPITDALWFIEKRDSYDPLKNECLPFVSRITRYDKDKILVKQLLKAERAMAA